MSDTARLLLTASVLSGTAFGAFAWTLTRLDASGPERLVGELRLAQWAALLLAAMGAVSIGIAVANEAVPFAPLDVTAGAAMILVAALVLRRDPRQGLLIAAGGFVLHALVDIAHRPGVIWPDIAPRWYAIGCAVYDVYLAAVCYAARRR